MRVAVDRSHCQGHTMCALAAPDLFNLDDDGHAYVDTDEVAAGQEVRARSGAAACPERAIRVED